MSIQFLPRACAAPVRSRRFHHIARALPLAAVLAWLPAQAQTGDAVHHVPEGEGAITVDGVRQAYRGDFSVKEIPQAITEIDAETLQQNNILRLTDALDMNAILKRPGPTLLDVRIDGEEVPPMDLRMQTLEAGATA